VIPNQCANDDEFEGNMLAELAGLHGLALRLCRDRSSAADLVQDTVERALGNRARFVPGTQLASWLRTIMRNIFADGWRRANVCPELCGVDMHLVVDWQDESPQADSLWRHVDDVEVRAALSQLPEPLRIVFELHTSENLSYGELAARLQIPPATVGTRLLRARRRLRALLTARRTA
jgi:RNA polymerase sigma-70 factor (ECF subfamily)